MVRVGGISYTIDPTQSIGKRISDMRLVRTGKPVDASKTYTVAGWASVNQNTKGPAIWDVVTKFVADRKSVSVPESQLVKVVGA